MVKKRRNVPGMEGAKEKLGPTNTIMHMRVYQEENRDIMGEGTTSGVDM